MVRPRAALAAAVVTAAPLLIVILLLAGSFSTRPAAPTTGPTPSVDRPATPTAGAVASGEPGAASPVASAGTATSAPAASPTTTTAASVVFVGAGDIADCRSEGDTQTAAILDALPGAAVFTLGDNAYEDGSLREYEDCFGPTWGRHRERTWPAPGNHEYRTAGAAGYFAYFGDRAGPDGRGYYAFELGGWRVYSLNSNCEAIGGCGGGSSQLAWLRDDLANHPAACVLAYWHHPRYSSSEHGSDDVMDAAWDALVEARAELVLAGHDHAYERFAPMNASGDAAANGITSFVVGTGGRSHYGFEEILPTSVARSTGVWGVLELTLAPDAWSSRFVPVPGGTFTDAASGDCH